MGGVEGDGLVDDLACNLGRFASEKFVQHLSGGGRVGDSRVGLRVIQPNMVKQGSEFVGAQGHHLLSQGDGIYEWEVHVLPVWDDALGFSKNHLGIKWGVVCHEHQPIYTCGELGVDLWEGGGVGDISIGDAVDVGVFNLLAVRINQRVPLVDKPEGFIKAGDGEFNDAVVSLVKPRGLCVNDGKDRPARLQVGSVV